MPNWTGYLGPVVLLTLAEAAAIRPANPTTPEQITAARKIDTALNSDPQWRTPTR